MVSQAVMVSFCGRGSSRRYLTFTTPGPFSIAVRNSSRRFSFTSVNVSSTEPPQPRYAPMQMKAMAASSDEALPVEPGKGTVTVSVSGTVQMKP